MKVSIIIPCYNVEKYLEECLNSVINQDYTDWEAICINDGSTDNTLSILQEFQKKDNRIKVISRENKGLSETRNDGFKLAAGEYIYYLDSDDYLLPGGLGRMVSAMDKDSFDFVFFDIEAHDEVNNKPICQHHVIINPDKRKEAQYKIMSGKELLTFLDGSNLHVPVYQYIYRKSFLENNNITFYKGITGEDVLYTFKCLLASSKIQYVPETAYVYRIRENSIMTSKTSFLKLTSLFCNTNEIYRILQTEELSEGAQHFFMSQCKRRLASLIDIYKSLGEPELDQIEFRNPLEKYLFKELIINKISSDALFSQKLNSVAQEKDNQISELESSIQKKNGQISELQSTIQNNDKQISELKSKIENLNNSTSMKIGRFLTYVPWKIKNLFHRPKGK